MSYSSNYTNRTTIFDTGDRIEGDHIKAIYEELGANPGQRLLPNKITVSPTTPTGAVAGDLWIDTSTVL